MLKVRLFGTGEICYDGHFLTGFPGQQCYVLLCYLILNRHRLHPRERLAAIFWGDYTTAASRKHLRNTLWRLRCALQSLGASVDEYLAIGDDAVAFLDSSPYWLDVQDFECAIARCQDLEGAQLTPEQALSLERAIALYVGDLLEQTYEDWCLYDRERLRLLYMNTLGKLMGFHEFQGSYERGLAFGKRILVFDPTREQVHRRIMQLYWLLGDRHEALAQYKLCAQILHEEMGIAPMAKTTLLYDQMVHGQFDPVRQPIDLGDNLLARIRQVQSIQPVAGQLLQKLNHLEALTKETSTELQDIQHLMNQLVISISQF